MAASGINEHNEARRKQNFIDRAAYMQKQIIDNMGQEGIYPSEGQAMCAPATPRLSPAHDGVAVDRQRREWALQHQYAQYTAKIPNRYNSTMYNQQW